MKRCTALILVLVVLFSCTAFGACGDKREDKAIILGYDNTGEEAILAGMLTTLIETYTDIQVSVIGDLAGGETVLHPSIIAGEIDMYPEYTGTAWLSILKHTDIPDRETLNAQLFEEYEANYSLQWVGLYGFNNSYGLAVSNTIAEEYGLETYSDLARISSQLIFGAEPGFYERDDAYDGLCETYGYTFKSSVDLTFSLKYDAIADKKVDVIDIFTTDGRLAISDVKVLTDDLSYFPEYRCGTVIRMDTLEKYPELRDVLMKMDGLITDLDMSGMNYLVEVEGKEPEQVATDFLTEKGLI